MKQFKDLLRSEIKKAERLANIVTKSSDCKVTGWYWDGKYEKPFDFDPDMMWVKVKCEICHNGEERADVDIVLGIPMFDRRKTVARVA